MGEDGSPDRDLDGDNGHEQQQQQEEDPIQEKIAKIIQICKENDALFGDSEYPAND